MSSAVHSLQKDILAGKQSLTRLLRQTKVIAAKLKLSDMEQWVDLELKGYPKDSTVPEYRNLATTHLEIRNPYYGWQHAGNMRMVMPSRQPISEIEALANGEEGVLNLEKNFPLQDESYTGIGATLPQRVVIPGANFKRVIEAVTDELLEWAIELEKRGIKGDDMNFNEKEKQAATHQTFNIQKFTGVLGNVTDSQLTVYDYSSVHQLLIDHDVPMRERHELEEIMEQLKTAPPEKKPSWIQKGKRWIIKNKELLGAAAEAVGKAIGAAMDKK